MEINTALKTFEPSDIGQVLDMTLNTLQMVDKQNQVAREQQSKTEAVFQARIDSLLKTIEALSLENAQSKTTRVGDEKRYQQLLITAQQQEQSSQNEAKSLKDENAQLQIENKKLKELLAIANQRLEAIAKAEAEELQNDQLLTALVKSVI